MKRLFAAETIEAVGACTRTMQGPDNADALLSRSDAATLGALRAAGDRLALRNRFHDDRIHQQHRPEEAVAAELFDALALARLDAIGAHWLEGVARNLLAHPGRDDDGVRWIAFEAFTSRAAPASKHHLVATIRAALSTELLDGLSSLDHDLPHHAQFAERSAAWARQTAAHIPSTVTPGAST